MRSGHGCKRMAHPLHGPPLHPGLLSAIPQRAPLPARGLPLHQLRQEVLQHLMQVGQGL